MEWCGNVCFLVWVDEGQKVGVYAVRLARFFLKFVTELIGIGFLIFKTDAYRLRSVFQLIAVRFFAVDLIGLVGLKH